MGQALTTANQIPYDILVEGGDEDVGAGQSSAVLRCKVAYAFRNRWLTDMVGYSQSTGDPKYINRSLPQQHPSLKWLWGSRCKRVMFAGQPGQDVVTQTVTYPYLIYDVLFTARNYEIRSDNFIQSSTNGGREINRYVERKRAFAVENFRIPGRGFSWVTGGTHPNLQENQVVPFGVQELNYVWHQVPKVPINNITACIGRVNSAYFDPTMNYTGSGFTSVGYPPQSLLLMGVDIDDRDCEKGFASANFLTAGDDKYNITYKFGLKLNGIATGLIGIAGDAIGWNYVWRTASGQFELATSDGSVSGNRIYTGADMNLLFQLN